MKRLILFFLITLLTLIFIFTFAGCDMLLGDLGGTGGGGNNNDDPPQIDNETDLNVFVPQPEDGGYIEGETYYKSNSVSLVTEVNGNYSIDRPFTLDKDDESKRIYHNLYLYEGDFFQVIYYKEGDLLGQIFASLSDEGDSQYATVEYDDGGNPLQLNIIEQGVYDLILDVETMAIDMVKVSDIDTPVYETITSCEIYVHMGLSNYTYTEMAFNEETNEFYIEKEIPRDAVVGFFSASHTSRYNITVEDEAMDKVLYWNDQSPNGYHASVGGLYKIYLNAKTYQVRVELLNPDTAEYYCQVGTLENNELSPVSASTPYLFEYTFVAVAERNDPYVSLPRLYPELGMKYKLSIIDEQDVTALDEYVDGSGTYKLTINLKDFTLTVEKISD